MIPLNMWLPLCLTLIALSFALGAWWEKRKNDKDVAER